MFISIVDNHNAANYINVDNIQRIKDRADGECEIVLNGDTVYSPMKAAQIMDQIAEKQGS